MIEYVSSAIYCQPNAALNTKPCTVLSQDSLYGDTRRTRPSLPQGPAPACVCIFPCSTNFFHCTTVHANGHMQIAQSLGVPHMFYIHQYYSILLSKGCTQPHDVILGQYHLKEAPHSISSFTTLSAKIRNGPWSAAHHVDRAQQYKGGHTPG